MRTSSYVPTGPRKFQVKETVNGWHVEHYGPACDGSTRDPEEIASREWVFDDPYDLVAHFVETIGGADLAKRIGMRSAREVFLLEETKAQLEEVLRRCENAPGKDLVAICAKAEQAAAKALGHLRDLGV